MSEINQTPDTEVDTLRLAAAAPDAYEAEAKAFEARVRKEHNAQFARLKDEAQAIFGMVNGRPGVRSPTEWRKLLEKAGDDIGNGRFLVRSLGAERYLDAETVSVLVTLRQNLIAERENTTTADIMMIDAAVLAYYNMHRIQGWIGNMSLSLERHLFGQRSELSELKMASEGATQLHRLSEVMLPLQERCHRMMARSLAAIA